MNKTIRKSLVLIMLFSIILTGCGKGDPKPGGVGSDPAEEENPKEDYYAFHSDYVLPETPYTEENKTYAPTLGAGHWERTDYKKLDSPDKVRKDGDLTITAYRSDEDFSDMVFDFEGPDGKEAHWDAYLGSMSDKYGINGFADPCITFKLADFEQEPEGEIFGSFYFADIEEGDDAFGQKVTVRQYFEKRQSHGKKTIKMTHFSANNDGYGGGADDNEGVRHTYFYPTSFFPKMADMGDKINVVLDVYDVKDAPPRFRNIWEYTYMPDSEEDIKERKEAEEMTERSQREDPDWWEKREYPGQWNLTDIKYINPVNNDIEKDGIKIHAERMGVDGGRKIYTFTDTAKGESVTYEVPEVKAQDQYADGFFYQEIEIDCDSEAEDPIGYVTCSLAFGDVDFNSGKYGVKVEPERYFVKNSVSAPVEAFSPIPHGETMYWWEGIGGYTSLEGSFPNGTKDGEKKYLVLGVMDSVDKGCRMFDIYEYTWEQGPLTVYEYNPPMPD